MTITFTGDRFGSTERILTNCHSFDWSLGDSNGNLGFPKGSFIEMYGDKNVGKSTFALGIMGILATALGKNIVMLDWEGQSRETVENVLRNAGFEGEVNYMLNVAKETSEQTIARFVKALYEENQPVALMDSLGAFRPTANMEGDLSDANMGAFARESGRFADWVIAAIQRSENPGCIFMTNHLHPKIGFRVTGQDTAGGVKKKYLAQVRIDLKRAFMKNKDGSEGGTTIDFGESWLLQGHIDSSRFGYSKRDFYVYMVAGEGIHLGLTALWDCIMAGYADLSAKKITEATTVSLDGQSFGKLGVLIRNRHETEQFIPFSNKLKEMTRSQPEDEEEEPVKKPKSKSK